MRIPSVLPVSCSFQSSRTTASNHHCGRRPSLLTPKPTAWRPPQHRQWRSTEIGRMCIQPRLTGRSTDTQSASVDELESWARSGGIKQDKLVATLFSGIRGMAAVADISAGEVFVTLPVDRALVVRPKQRCPFPNLCAPPYWRSSPWWVKMALMLHYEQQRGQESPYWPYVASLPRAYPVPMNWQDGELDELQYPYLRSEVKKQQEAWGKLHKEVVAATPGTRATLEGLLWALQAVRSRAFSGPYAAERDGLSGTYRGAGPTWKQRAFLAASVVLLGAAFLQFLHAPIEQVLNGVIAAALFNLLYDVLLSQKVRWYAMCPVIDLLNHKGSVESSVEYQYFKDEFAVSCNVAFKKGQQVFISYGQQGNDSLLQFYGFMERDNPVDAFRLVDLPRRIRDAAAELGLEMVDALAQGQDEGVLGRKGPDAATLAAVKQALKGVEGDSSTVAHQVIVRMCERELAARTSIEADQAILKTPRLLSDAAVLAVKFRLEKKQILAGCLKHCQEAGARAEPAEASVAV